MVIQPCLDATNEFMLGSYFIVTSFYHQILGLYHKTTSLSYTPLNVIFTPPSDTPHTPDNISLQTSTIKKPPLFLPLYLMCLKWSP